MLKPTNTNKPLNPGDGAGLPCDFMAQTDPPKCWERCETDATVRVGESTRDNFDIWASHHPRATIDLYPGNDLTLCDTHWTIIQEVLNAR